MNKKYLLYVTLFVFIAIVALAFSGIYQYKKQESNVLGKYTFLQTKQNIRRMSHIRITTAQDGSINLYREGEFWRFKEAANYFINPEALANFYSMINNSLIMTAQPSSKRDLANSQLLQPSEKNKKNTGTRIEIFDEEDTLLDDMIIGGYLNDGEYRFARKTDGTYIYTVSHIGIFDGRAQSWIPYPLLSLKNHMIEALILDGKILDRQLLNDIKPHLSFIRKLLETLDFLGYTGIATRKDFFANYPDAEPQKITVLTPLGLNYVLNVYWVDNVYWLTIHLQMNKIAYKKVREFIGENQKYFDKWVFELSNDQGEALYHTQIADHKTEHSDIKENNK